MGLKIDLTPPRWLRKASLKFAPRDFALGARIITGTASPLELVGKAVELATPGQTNTHAAIDAALQHTNIPLEGTTMQTQGTSWRKITITLLSMAAVIMQLLMQPHTGNTANAAVIISGLLVTLIIALVFVLTQGKVDLARMTAPGTIGATAEAFLEQKLAQMLQPQLNKIEGALTNLSAITDAPATAPVMPAAPTTIDVQIIDNGNGTLTLPDGTVWTPKQQ